MSQDTERYLALAATDLDAEATELELEMTEWFVARHGDPSLDDSLSDAIQADSSSFGGPSNVKRRGFSICC